MKPRVLLDCDGVLSDFTGGFLDLVNAEFGTNHQPADVTSYDIAESLGWGAAHARRAYDMIRDAEGFASYLRFLPGSQDGVRELQRIADIYVVTSPWWSAPTWCNDRTNWLRSYFGIEADHIVHTSAKHICVGDFLVDDKTSTLVKWQAEHPRAVAVQWQTLHNRRDAWTGPSTCDWAELVAMVEKRRPPTGAGFLAAIDRLRETLTEDDAKAIDEWLLRPRSER